MIKNDVKINLLFVLFACFMAGCVSNRSTVSSKSADSRNVSHVRKDVERYAQQYIGSKYKYGGKTPKGFDCSGFTRYVYDKVNVALSPSSKLQAKQGKKINMKWVKKGDLIFFGNGGRISHVALVVDNKKDGIYVIHSTTSRGVIKENVSQSSYWKRRMMFARSVLE